MTETISRLMEANLLGVFNERDAGRRAAMINTIYSPDVRWTDDEGSTVGREALDAKATALQSQMQGLVFTKAGPVYETLGLGYMAFELGPPGGEPVACGFDVAVVRNGLISELYTVITGPRGDGPSQLLQAFIGYLRARPTAVDSGSAAFVDGSSELEGVSRRSTELGGVPAITLQPQVGSPGRTVLYFHPRCSSRSVRTRSSTTMPPVSEMPPPRLVSTCPSSLGDTEFTSGRSSSRPGYQSPLRPSNAWPPSSRHSLVIGQWVGGLPRSRDEYFDACSFGERE